MDKALCSIEILGEIESLFSSLFSNPSSPTLPSIDLHAFQQAIYVLAITLVPFVQTHARSSPKLANCLVLAYTRLVSSPHVLYGIKVWAFGRLLHKGAFLFKPFL